MPRFGLGSADNLRVLVCDGPSLLGWVGVFREGSFGRREQRTLQRLVPALQRRLLVERHIATAPSTRARLDAMFAAIPMPAFLTDIAGTVLEANAAASLWLEREGREGRERLRDAVKRRRDPRFDVTPVVAPGLPEMRLVLLRASADLTTLRAAQAAQRWAFTTRQAKVLGLLVEGLTTRTIAAALGVSERTIELHLTALFEKTQVESRAELVAAVWRNTG